MKDCEIIEVSDFIREVSLTQLAEMTFCYNFKEVLYEEIKGRKILFSFAKVTQTKFLKRLIKKHLVTEILLTEVESYKRIILYNPLRGTCIYTNDPTGIHYEGTYVILVTTFPSPVKEAVIERIKEFLK